MPAPVCDNLRIRRCRLYPSEELRVANEKAFRHYEPSKQRYFCGLWVHMVVTGAGGPVGFALATGSEADITVFKELDLPEGSFLFADKGCTDYYYEDLPEEVGLHLKAQRKKNPKHPLVVWE